MTALPTPPEDTLNHLGEDPIVLGLKQLYDAVLSEPVPDDFLGLLSQIDARLAEVVAARGVSTGSVTDELAPSAPMPEPES